VSSFASHVGLGAGIACISVLALWSGFGPEKRLPGRWPIPGATRKDNPVRFWLESIGWAGSGIFGLAIAATALLGFKPWFGGP
jgi:hypothetical protein